MSTLIIFGDSLTYGYGAKNFNGWALRIAEDFEKIDPDNLCYNLGIPGDTSSGLMFRLPHELRSRSIRWNKSDTITVIISVGINDSRIVSGKPQVAGSDFENNMNVIIKSAKSLADKTIIIGITPVGPGIVKYKEYTYTNKRVAEYNAILKKASLGNDVEFIDVFNGLIGGSYQKNLRDGIHPNRTAYEMIYRSMIPKIRKYYRNHLHKTIK